LSELDVAVAMGMKAAWVSYCLNLEMLFFYLHFLLSRGDATDELGFGIQSRASACITLDLASLPISAPLLVLDYFSMTWRSSESDFKE